MASSSTAWVALSNEGFHVRQEGKDVLLGVAGQSGRELDVAKLQRAFLDVRRGSRLMEPASQPPRAYIVGHRRCVPVHIAAL